MDKQFNLKLNTIRSESILEVLDPVHRSLLLNNLQFEGHKMPHHQNHQRNLSDEVKSENKQLNLKSTHTNLNNTQNTNNNTTHIIQNESVLENLKNAECEKSNKKCSGGICYCFSSDSDDFARRPREPVINLFGNRFKSGNSIDLLRPDSCCSNGSSSDDEKTTDEDFFTSQECNDDDRNKTPELIHTIRKLNRELQESPAIKVAVENKSISNLDEIINEVENIKLSNSPVKSIQRENSLNGTTTIKIRITTKSKRKSEENKQNIVYPSITSAEDAISTEQLSEDDSNCSEYNSYINERTPSPPLNKNKEKKYRKTPETHVAEDKVEQDNDSPAIHIVQELTEHMTVTSTVNLNKSKIRQLQNPSSKITSPSRSTNNKEKSSKPKKRIIDDNFCNEILDNINQSFDTTTEEYESSIVETEDSQCSFIYSEKLNGSPKYSGKQVGELYAKRMKRIEKIKSQHKSAKKNIKVITTETDRSDSSQGPKKPPRTFAASSNTTVECDEVHLYNRFQNLITSDVQEENKFEPKVAKACPTFEQLGCHVGWVPPGTNNRSGGWIFVDDNGNRSEPPNKLLNMLNYDTNPNIYSMTSENLKPHPQSSCRTKENIDDVDASVFRITTGNSPKKKLNDFEIFAQNTTIKSTPEKRNVDQISSANLIFSEKREYRRAAGLDVVADTKRIPEKRNFNQISSANLIASERGQHKRGFSCGDINDIEYQNEEDVQKLHVCKKCQLKKSTKEILNPKTAIRRTKSFFKCKIKPKLITGKKYFFKQQSSSDSEMYKTPEKADTTSTMNQIGSFSSSKRIKEKKIGFTPIIPEKKCSSCHDSKSTSSNTTPKVRKTINFDEKNQTNSVKRNFDFTRKVQSPKLVQKAKSFKLTPRRLFVRNSETASNPTPELETYKSYENDDETLTIMMKEYLTEIRKNLEDDDRKINIEINQFQQRMNDNANFIDEPIYEEVKGLSPPSLAATPPPPPSPAHSLHYTVNDNPTAIYAKVNKNKEFQKLSTVEDDTTRKENLLMQEKFQTKNISPSSRLQSKTFSQREQENYDEISSYDASKFLNAALGDEKNQTTNLEFHGYDTVDNTDFLDQSYELKSENLNESLNSSYSTAYNTPNNSRLNNSSDFYRGFKEKLRSSFRKGKNYIKNERRKLSGLFDDSSNHERREQEDLSPKIRCDNLKKFDEKYAERMFQTISLKLKDKIEISDKYLLKLFNQISYQRSIRNQLGNAVSICRNTREFECSSELIEAERLLLLSHLKEAAAKQELVKIDYENDGMICDLKKRKGSILIDRIGCKLKEQIVNDTIFNYFYVCMCSYKEQVISTYAIERSGSQINFINCAITFDNLEPEYEIKLEIYALRLRKYMKNFSHESRYHLNKEDTRKFFLMCSSPQKNNPENIFYSSPSKLSPKFMFDAEFSRFKSQGIIILTSFMLSSNSSSNSNPHHLNNFQTFVRRCDDTFIFTIENYSDYKLSSMQYDSNIDEKIQLGYKTEIKVDNLIVDGFLTICDNSNDGGLRNWNRLWCKLDGFIINVWNYPNETNDKIIYSLDLLKGVQESIGLIDRTLCPRPRTFQIEIFQNCSVKSFFLSADNQIDLERWIKAINSKILFLRDWKL